MPLKMLIRGNGLKQPCQVESWPSPMASPFPVMNRDHLSDPVGLPEHGHQDEQVSNIMFTCCHAVDTLHKGPESGSLSPLTGEVQPPSQTRLRTVWGQATFPFTGMILAACSSEMILKAQADPVVRHGLERLWTMLGCRPI